MGSPVDPECSRFGINPAFDIIIPITFLGIPPQIVVQEVQEKIRRNGGTEEDETFWAAFIFGFQNAIEEKIRTLQETIQKGDLNPAA